MIQSKIANLSSMIYYDKPTKNSTARNMPFYPDCNMRLLSEVNMTTTSNQKQMYTMEQIMKNYKNSKLEYDLGSNMSLVLYEMTTEQTPLTSDIISANVVEHGTRGSVTMVLRDRFARAVKIGTVKEALGNLNLSTSWVEGAFCPCL